MELTTLLVTSHAKRAAAREPGRLGLLDRGMPMLLAAAAATCVVKDSLSVREALWTVHKAATPWSAPAETSILLMPSLDPERSCAIARARDSDPWTGIYPTYQRVLHEILLRQAEAGAYDLVVDCEDLDRSEVHQRIVDGIAVPLPAAVIGEDSNR
jgi:hypothetical protein